MLKISAFFKLVSVSASNSNQFVCNSNNLSTEQFDLWPSSTVVSDSTSALMLVRLMMETLFWDSLELIQSETTLILQQVKRRQLG